MANALTAPAEASPRYSSRFLTLRDAIAALPDGELIQFLDDALNYRPQRIKRAVIRELAARLEADA